MNIHLNTLTFTEFPMLWQGCFTPRSVKRAPAALAVILIAAVACSDRDVPTGPQRSAAQHASRDIISPIDDLWISPNRRVTAGNTATGTITLKTPAPANGLQVMVIMSHHSPYVSPDTTYLFIPANASSQTFTIETSAEPDTLGIAFYAIFAGRTLFGNGFALYPGSPPPPPPPPVTSLAVTPDTLWFGAQAPGTQSAAQYVTLHNTGATSITPYLYSAQFGATGPFKTTGNNCPTYLGAGASCSISVVYVPTTGAVAQSGVLTIPTSAPSSPNHVTLIGTPAPWISVTPMSISWGAVTVGNATSGRVIDIRNTGTAPLVISSLGSGGANPGDFPIVADACSGATLSPGTSCAAYVSFEPLRIGARSATVTISHNASGGTTVVSLSGSGKSAGGYIP